MRLGRFLNTLAAAIMLAGFSAAQLPPAASAQGSTKVWVEFATVTPGANCAVTVSVDGGQPLSGARISLVVRSDYSGKTVSSDTATANDRGVAWLTIDTSGSGAADKTWANVIVNGEYAGGRTVRIEPGNACSGSPVLVTMSGTFPANAPAASAPAQTASTGATLVPGAFTYQQQRPLSCEFAALSIASGMLGKRVSEYDFEAAVPLSANPHWGFRGNINGTWGNTTDYGVYAAPLVPALNRFGFEATWFYGKRADLERQIDLGRPTLVWLGMRGDEGSFDAYTSDGVRFGLTPYMHVVLVYGYDDAKVYVSDPGTGEFRTWDWQTFEAMWDVIDGMALAVHW